ncbi:hypothetical protein VTK73DRAFT_7734 [Phialemonium thermophilum]|uniref:Uncharacterized protein n=1 Tax=Phialemonium thermophilum TaxID=223376 RepID=A0ABR3WCW2_9PEZI
MPPVYYFRGEGVAAPEQADEAGGSRPFLEVEFAPAVADGRTGPSSPYSLEVFRNITNQPIFANASTCDNMIRVFDSDLSAGPEHAPAVVRGRVRASQVAPWQGMAQADGEVVGDGEEEAGSLGEWEWTGVYGVQVATPFIENGYLECRSLQGYTGEGGPGARLRKASGSHDEI